MSQGAAEAITLLAIALGAVGLPWLAMSALVPTLSGAGTAINYRGKPVTYGLGLVWVVWTIGILAAGATLGFIGNATDPGAMQPYSVLPRSLPFTLVLGALVLGLADDVFGSGEEKGFRGHLGALLHGRLTTGGLKLLGIGLLAALTLRPDLRIDSPAGWGMWVLMVLAVALTANLINLMDLRPGRALKVYSLLAVLAAVSFGAYGQWSFSGEFGLALLGPVLTVWRFDLGERGMLGDAGANAAGALIGWVAATVIPVWWGLAIYVALVAALNVASERVSFSRVIEGNRMLSWLDNLGRLPNDDAPGSDTSAKTSPQSDTLDR